MRREIKLLAYTILDLACCGAALADGPPGNCAAVGKGGFLVDVIGFEQCPAGDFLDSNRHLIPVQADYTGTGTDKSSRRNKIFLKAGGFRVIDGNGCDNDGACDQRVGLFDAFGEDYWWNWDTSGRPHVQLVFIPVG